MRPTAEAKLETVAAVVADVGDMAGEVRACREVMREVGGGGGAVMGCAGAIAVAVGTMSGCCALGEGEVDGGVGCRRCKLAIVMVGLPGVESPSESRPPLMPSLPRLKLLFCLMWPNWELVCDAQGDS